MQDINFVNEVAGAFAFLEHEYRFRPVGQNSTYVRYESADVYVAISHDRLGEVSVVANLISSDPERRYGYLLQELLKVMGVPKEGRFPDLFGRELHTLRSSVKKLATWLRADGAPILIGDGATFLKAHDYRISETKKNSIP